LMCPVHLPSYRERQIISILRRVLAMIRICRITVAAAGLLVGRLLVVRPRLWWLGAGPNGGKPQ
jgi:hypothetical protein